MARFEIQGATTADEAELYALATHLNTVNLPADREAIARLLRHSEQSFTRTIASPREREYVFLLRDRQTGAALGTSTIIGQLGRPGEPYIYLQVDREEKYSATLAKHFIHRVLSVRYVYEGPTEIGGLVVHPHHRNSRDKLGTLISFARFLFIAMRRVDFRDEVLAELLPPLEPDGLSHLWEALGRHFTGLTYAEADRLSKRNKEFIRGLWPQGEIYAILLPPAAQAVIGSVGRQTKGVEKILRRIGFRYAERIDPFDGGPHFVARTDDVSLVSQAQRVELEPASGMRLDTRVIVARALQEPPYFVGVPTLTEWRDARSILVDEAVHARFAELPDGPTWVMPLPLGT
jgi:arginine N-succinyltransferase